MLSELRKLLPDGRIRDRYIDLVSFAADAGFYYLLPKAVVQLESEQEVISLFQFCHQHKMPVVFRTGGTSLSGQSITDGILVDLSQRWNRIAIEDQGRLVRVQPGITGAAVNSYLRRHKRKLGPDPSSISAAMIGGILSNNASGMCCGVKLNSYHTLKYIRFILPDGKLFSTENPFDYQTFENQCPALFQTLTDIRQQISRDRTLYNKIRKKYQTKTTIGYSLNAFIDFVHPLDILAHLLIGAEGTLGFISEAVMKTIPDLPYKATALLYFPTIYDACQAIEPLNDAGAMMVELMDRSSLRAIENLEGISPDVKSLPPGAAALLIEFQEKSLDQVNQRVEQFLLASSELSLMHRPMFTTDTKEQAFLWKVRKGLFPAVGAVRASGSTVILEDVAFPIEKLGDAILDLQKLFSKYDYSNAIIFGHAKDGNIHFVITQSFNTKEDITRYDLFIKDVVDVVVNKYDGTLKAEHGTGRNMAPFVETEWGGEAYQIFKQIKNAIDPAGILNPGVIINEDPNIHIKDFKNLPAVEEEVDRCIECGYCEHKCPSRNITTTPRRRIVIRRVLKHLENSGDKKQYRLLKDQYQFDGLDTCAVDGLCATACPVDINTGDLIKRLRRENHSKRANKIAMLTAKHFKTVEWLIRGGLNFGAVINKLFGSHAMVRVTRCLKKAIPSVPLWSGQLLRATDLSVLRKKRSRPLKHLPTIVYFPACISRTMGSYPGQGQNLMETFASICTKACIELLVLDNVLGSCCGQIFSSKGFSQAYSFTGNKIIEQLWLSTNFGKLPVVIDVSSCAYTLKMLRPILNNENKKKFDQLTILDTVDFLRDMVMPFVGAKPNDKHIVLHPVCSLQKMKTEDKFLWVAKYFAKEVTVPKSAGCCGMAGDRGFLFPELTQSATQAEAIEVQKVQYDGYYSSTKTCEIAMSEAVKANYESILYLVDEMMIPIR